MAVQRSDIGTAIVAAPLVAFEIVVVLGPGRVLKLLWDWQTLASGILAVIAAALGGLFILHQSRQAARLERERQHRLARAARAMLPFTLSGLVGWFRQVGAPLGAMLTCAPPKIVPPASLSFAPPPADTTAGLRELVEVSDDGLSLEAAELLRELQVITARLSDLQKGWNGFEHRSTVTTYAVQVARAYALTVRLFAYARADTDVVPNGEPSEQEYLSGLSQACEIWGPDPDYEDVIAFAKRRRGIVAARRGEPR